VLFGAYSNANVNKSTPNSTIKVVITKRALKLSSLKLRTTLPIAGLCISCNLTRLFLRASVAWCRASAWRLLGVRRRLAQSYWLKPLSALFVTIEGSGPVPSPYLSLFQALRNVLARSCPWFTCGKSDTRGGGALLSGTQVLLKTSLFRF
jgi:hypothetical protein